MKKLLILTSLVVLACAFALVGCGENTDTAGETAAETATETTAETVTETATDAIDAATDAVEAIEDATATLDCAGECGMKDVPKAQMTEIDGKFYCAGCAHAMSTDDHSGHGHG